VANGYGSCCGFALSAPTDLGVRDARALRADSVFQRFDRTDSPGCALGVYQDGRILYARGYGMESLEHGVALSPRSVLDVGSISKQFTAMSILMLQKEGKLSLDDPIRKYIPELPPYADKITLRRALSQTSGLRDLYIMMGQTGRTFAGDTIDALRVITKRRLRISRPLRSGSQQHGYFLLSQVKRVSGQTARPPTPGSSAPGMTATHFHDDHTRSSRSRHRLLPGAAGGYTIEMSGFEQTGDGAVNTSIEELFRWDQNWYDGTVGGKDPRSSSAPAVPMVKIPATRRASSSGYRGLKTVRHGGAGPDIGPSCSASSTEDVGRVPAQSRRRESFGLCRPRSRRDPAPSLQPNAVATNGAAAPASITPPPEVLAARQGLAQPQDQRHLPAGSPEQLLARFGADVPLTATATNRFS
jgi:CubicO group peptidase (beta-lactamase class C family)